MNFHVGPTAVMYDHYFKRFEQMITLYAMRLISMYAREKKKPFCHIYVSTTIG